MKVKAVPRDCRGTNEEDPQYAKKTFTLADAEDLRHQMYLYCINYGFCKDKEEAKLLLKRFGFLTNKKKTKTNKTIKNKAVNINIEKMD